MRCSIRLASVLAVVTLLGGGDLLACGDKFLVASRGTRYQRPKNARTASIVIYAEPGSSNPVVVGSARMESMLRRSGHRAMTVTTIDQLSSILKGGGFDVIVAASDTANAIRQVVKDASGAAVVLAIDAAPTAASLLKAVDQAVVQHDEAVRINRSGS
jgi:hypothetical protein